MAVLWRGRHGTFPSTSLCACADYASALGQGIHALPHLAVLKHLWPPAPLATPPHTTCALRCDGRIVLAAPFVLDLQSSSSTARSGMDERRPCRAWAGRRWGHCVLHAGVGWAREFYLFLRQDAVAHDWDFSSSTCCHLACGTRSRSGTIPSSLYGGDGSASASLEPFKR
ncbi:hypothetical protein B0H13DRAFT_1970055 [Mycena leptocephala]|nr:hypothetical protein B0H13DRAFT_1970055 [Mycena leptocephala]